MSRFSPALRDLLAPAAEAARVALVDLDADEVPASLRRVVSHSGGRLPPPLAASLLEALDDDEWLRDRAAAELRPGLEGSAAAALLERGEGWWVKVAAELAESRVRGAEKEAERAADSARRLQDQIDVAAERLKRAGAKLEAERAKSRARRASGRAPAPEVAVAKAVQARARELESDLADETRDRIDAESMMARLRSRVVSLRREQRGQDEKGPTGSSLGDDFLALAKRSISWPRRCRTAHACPPDSTESGGPPTEGQQLELPPGIRPDAREAVDWLASRARPPSL